MSLEKENKKNTKKKTGLFRKALFIISGFAFFVFVFASLDLLTRNSYGSRSFWIELGKLCQLCFLAYILVSLIVKKNRLIAWLVGSFLIFLQIIFSAYFLLAKKPLDFMFFMLNKNNLVDVFSPYSLYIFLVLVAAGLVGYFFIRIVIKDYKKILALTLFLAILLTPPLVGGKVFLNETFVFVKSAFVKDEVIDLYQIHYRELVEDSIRDKKLLQQRIDRTKKEKKPEYLENVVFLQLESLNADLMSKEITPNFFKIAERGVYFPNFYSNGVQTILGQENLLCSLPSSFYSNLNSTGNDKKVFCLPEFFNRLNYKTAFFKTYDLNFTNTGDFMRNIGFSETHVEDIMQAEDPQYHWGYREDVFYERAFSYIQENFEQKNNFLFLEVGPTNHWPFNTPSEYSELVPHKNPKSQKERLENTMFLQDMHLGVALKKLDETFPRKNYTLMILGDHSWPTGKHDGNEFCGSGPFEENFKTGFTMVFGDGELDRGRIVEESASQMDIMPTVMAFWDMKFSTNSFRSSLFELRDDDKRQIILVQPFSERFLAFIDKEQNKAIYNSDKKSWEVFNLKESSEELVPVRSVSSKVEVFDFATEKIPLVSNEQIIMHALGGIDGYDYTNSKEALELSIKKKRKLYEIDVNLSSDNKLVLSHSNKVDKSQAEFERGKTKGGFTPATLEMVLDKMEQNKDMILVTDVKGSDYTKVAEALFSEIKKRDEDIVSRVVPEIYNEATFKLTKNKFGFQKMIYTLYKDRKSDVEVVKFVKDNLKNIPIVVMSKTRFNEKLNWQLRRMGVRTFVHTINDEKEIIDFRKKGAYGIFTDSY